MKDRNAPPEPKGKTSETWNSVPWKKLEQHCFRIQKRIYRASQRGNQRAVQKLQKLLMKSEAARMLAVRRVTQENQGKKTAGVDGVKSVKPKERLLMAQQLHPKHWKHSKSKPVRRVWIPKPGKDERRPLGIPTMFERGRQCLAKLALEPEWEARFEANSYGFRPGRSCHDAIAAIFNGIRFKSKFVLDADLKACFDAISHQWLLAHIPMEKAILKKWLKAGYLEQHILYPTEAGTPQGGIISPVLANMTLDGLERMLRQHFPKVKTGKGALVNFVRYADDFLVTGRTKELLEQEVQPLSEEFLRERGLPLSPEKTLITHIKDGLDFLGQVRPLTGKGVA